MKKRYSTIIIILIILIIAVYSAIFILINNNKEDIPILQQNSSSDDVENTVKETEYVSNYFYTLFPKNLEEALENYNGPMDNQTIGRYFYRFITNDLKTIYKETVNLTTDDIAAKYQYDQITPETMNIYTQEDYVGIAKALQRAKNEDGTYLYKSASVDLETCENTENYFTFVVTINYENGKNINLRVNLSNKTNSIEFKKYSEFDDVYKLYQGEIVEEEFLDKFYNFIDKGLTFIGENSSYEKSLNAILQDYELNKDELNDYGIYIDRDYLYLANQAIVIGYNGTEKITGYVINEETIQNGDEYFTFDIDVKISNDKIIKIKANIANVKRTSPNVKISSDNIYGNNE